MNVFAVLKDRLFQTSSTKRFIVHCTFSSQGQIVPDIIHQEVHCALYLQFSRTDCSRHHPPRRSLCIVLAVLKDRLFQKTSTKKFIVLAVFKDRLFQTTSTNKFNVLAVLKDRLLQTSY
jgi:hypothetical protein